MTATTPAEPIFDKPDQMEKVRAGLMQGEQLFAVFDGIGAGTGFIGLTDRRIVLQDNSFIGKKQAVTSVPYRFISAVSFVADKSMFGKFYSTSSIAVCAGDTTYEVQFRGEDKAKYAHDLILWRITT